MLEHEEFFQIPNFSHYWISKSGKVISRYGHISNVLSTRVGPNGYLSFTATGDNGKRHPVEIHRILAIMFVPNDTNLPFSEIEVNHKNGIKTDNSLTNLEWCQHSYNQFHAYREGLRTNVTMIHARPVSSFYGEDQVFYSLREAARQFGCAEGTMQYQLNNARLPYKGYWFGYCDGRSN